MRSDVPLQGERAVVPSQGEEGRGCSLCRAPLAGTWSPAPSQPTLRTSVGYLSRLDSPAGTSGTRPPLGGVGATPRAPCCPRLGAATACQGCSGPRHPSRQRVT